MNNWMGRYKNLCSTLTRYSNIAARNATIKVPYPDYGFELSAHEWQILEFLIFNSNTNTNMTQISEYLGISVSSFSKHTNHLVKLGLLDKYKLKTNKKNIILRPSTLGNEFYNNTVKKLIHPIFQKLFDNLNDFSDEQIALLTEGLESLSSQLDTEISDDDILIKI